VLILTQSGRLAVKKKMENCVAVELVKMQRKHAVTNHHHREGVRGGKKPLAEQTNG